MIEYAEEYVDVRDGWTETLNRYADDGWRLHSIIPDEYDDGSDERIAGRFRLVFERSVDEEE